MCIDSDILVIESSKPTIKNVKISLAHRKTFLAKIFNTAQPAIAEIPSNSTLAVGGFSTSGVSENLLRD